MTRVVESAGQTQSDGRVPRAQKVVHGHLGKLDTQVILAGGCAVKTAATAFGQPVASPSANRSGHVSPTTAHVLADLRGRIEFIVDGGPAQMGLESTIVACLDEPRLLRLGALSRATIGQVLGLGISRGTNLSGGCVIESATAAATRFAASDPVNAQPTVTAPGQLDSHYAPRARLRLAAVSVDPEAMLAFGPHRIAGADAAVFALNLSPRGDLIEAAANLFSHLRALDASGAATIEVMPVPHAGLGEAINDRLWRTAAPR